MTPSARRDQPSLSARRVLAVVLVVLVAATVAAGRQAVVALVLAGGLGAWLTVATTTGSGL